MIGLLRQIAMLLLKLLRYLLFVQQALHKLVVRPCLGQRAEQEGQADQTRYPDYRAGKQRHTPRARPARRLLYAYRGGYIGRLSL